MPDTTTTRATGMPALDAGCEDCPSYTLCQRCLWRPALCWSDERLAQRYRGVPDADLPLHVQHALGRREERDTACDAVACSGDSYWLPTGDEVSP